MSVEREEDCRKKTDSALVSIIYETAIHKIAWQHACEESGFDLCNYDIADIGFMSEVVDAPVGSDLHKFYQNYQKYVRVILAETIRLFTKPLNDDKYPSDWSYKEWDDPSEFTIRHVTGRAYRIKFKDNSRVDWILHNGHLVTLSWLESDLGHIVACPEDIFRYPQNTSEN